MARMGRPPIFPDVEAFEARNPDGFFKWCEENNHKPLWEWFAVYIDCPRDTLLQYAQKDGMLPSGEYDNKQDFARAIKRIADRIHAYIIDNGLEGKYRDALTIFYLKNYGYTDRQEVKADMTVTLQIDGNGLFD